MKTTIRRIAIFVLHVMWLCSERSFSSFTSKHNICSDHIKHQKTRRIANQQQRASTTNTHQSNNGIHLQPNQHHSLHNEQCQQQHPQLCCSTNYNQQPQWQSSHLSTDQGRSAHLLVATPFHCVGGIEYGGVTCEECFVDVSIGMLSQ